MKTKHLLWSLFAVMAFSACADSGIDSVEETETKTEETVTKSTYIEIEKSGDYFSNGVFNLSSSTEEFNITIKTNIDKDKIEGYYYDNGVINENKYFIYDIDSNGSNESNITFTIPINKNSGSLSRGTYLVFHAADDKSIADTIVAIQDGANLKTSTDFSKDKTCEQLYTHTAGTGIPIVLMGNGFGDTEVSDGTYKNTMLKVVENLFSEQPVKALKQYFDIYMVYAVSKQNGVGVCYDTALGASLAYDGTSKVSADEDLAKNYENAVAKNYGITSKSNDFLSVVILNTNDYGGTTYMYTNSSTGKILNHAISYCPIIEGLDNELFRSVLTHEAIGHGLGKLADEYYYEQNTNLPSDVKKEIETHQKNGYDQNISTSATNTPWEEFLTDSYYTAKPDLTSVYEGGYEYTYGVWRPSNKSMMGDNDYPFNAPSRKLIYDRVLSLSGQKTSTFSQFKEFDTQNAPDFDYYKNLSSDSRATSGNENRHFAHPVVISE